MMGLSGDKDMSFKELTNEQARQSIDIGQVYETLCRANRELRQNYLGSMSWKTSNGRDYLYRKIRGRAKSIGPRSTETESILETFRAGRARVDDVIKGCRERLAQMAPVNRGLRLARVPHLTARILRELEEIGLLGRHIRVVGTNCLYAYEAAAGVQIDGSVLSTGDVDLLFDTRARLKLTVTEFKVSGIMGMLQRIDGSFDVLDTFRASNRSGFMVDLVTPFESKDKTRPRRKEPRLSDAPDDLMAAEIDGLAWLVSNPAFEQMAIGEDGLPVPMVCPDPRAFAMHKLWLAARADRQPLKRQRDRDQAKVVVRLMKERLSYLGDFSDTALTAVPAALRQAIEGLE